MSKHDLIVFNDPILTPAKVEWDSQGIMDKCQLLVDEYSDMVLTEQTLKAGKDVCTELNKLKKAIDDKKKDIKKVLTEDVKIFEAEVKQVIAKIDEAYGPIKGQIDGYEQARQDDKRQKVQKLIDELIQEQGLRNEYAAELVIQKSYLNKGTSLKSITAELESLAIAAGLAQDEYDKNIELIGEMVKSNNETFKVNLVSHQYIGMLVHMTVPQIMMEITKDAQSMVPVPVVKDEPVEEYHETINDLCEEGPTDANDEIFAETYDVEATELQLDNLQQYMTDNGIKFKVVE